MRGSSSGHVTSLLWLSPGKMNTRKRLLPGLLGLKAFQAGTDRSSMCVGRAEMIPSLEKSCHLWVLLVMVDVSSGDGVNAKVYIKRHDDVGEVS